MNEKIAYGNDVISTTENSRDQVRNRPQIYFGTNDLKGCLNGLFELVTNGSDELNAGYGDEIGVVVKDDYEITVRDNGRGAPMDWNEKDKKFNWDCIYNTLFSSGKGSGGIYKTAAGLNGVGAAITQFASLYMKVISRRIEEDSSSIDGIRKIEYEMNFRNGNPEGELIKRDWTGNDTGTIITYKADPSVFQDTHITVEMIADRMRKLATVTPNCHMKLQFMGNSEVDFFYKEGAKTFIEDACKKRITKEVITINSKRQAEESVRGNIEKFTVDIDAAFTFSYDENFVESYHNGTYLVENGRHYDGFKEAVRATIEGYARRNGKIGAKEKINIIDVEAIIVAVISSKFNGDFSSFDGQDKKAIKNESLFAVFKAAISDAFAEWAASNKSDMDKIVEAVMTQADARVKAASVKKKVLDKLNKKIADYRTRPEKLTDCESKDTAINEIYFVEGDSAKGISVMARNPKFQAIFPLTGKILNCLKARVEKILRNRVIVEMLQILGCGIELKSKYIKDLPKFDINKLNYGKIIIGTDADFDGAHIQTLLLIFIYRLMPTLLKEGKVYIAEAPLFMVILVGKKPVPFGNGKTYAYMYSDKELEIVVNELNKRGMAFEVKRFKGLGEMDREQMAEATMNPETRRLTKVEYPSDVEEFERTMNELLGKDIEGRKGWISEYFRDKYHPEDGAVVDDEGYIDEGYSVGEEKDYDDNETDVEDLDGDNEDDDDVIDYYDDNSEEYVGEY